MDIEYREQRAKEITDRLTKLNVELRFPKATDVEMINVMSPLLDISEFPSESIDPGKTNWSEVFSERQLRRIDGFLMRYGREPITPYLSSESAYKFHGRASNLIYELQDEFERIYRIKFLREEITFIRNETEKAAKPDSRDEALISLIRQRQIQDQALAKRYAEGTAEEKENLRRELEIGSTYVDGKREELEKTLQEPLTFWQRRFITIISVANGVIAASIGSAVLNEKFSTAYAQPIFSVCVIGLLVSGIVPLLKFAETSSKRSLLLAQIDEGQNKTLAETLNVNESVFSRLRKQIKLNRWMMNAANVVSMACLFIATATAVGTLSYIAFTAYNEVITQLDSPDAIAKSVSPAAQSVPPTLQPRLAPPREQSSPLPWGLEFLRPQTMPDQIPAPVDDTPPSSSSERDVDAPPSPPEN